MYVLNILILLLYDIHVPFDNKHLPFKSSFIYLPFSFLHRLISSTSYAFKGKKYPLLIDPQMTTDIYIDLVQQLSFVLRSGGSSSGGKSSGGGGAGAF